MVIQADGGRQSGTTACAPFAAAPPAAAASFTGSDEHRGVCECGHRGVCIDSLRPYLKMSTRCE